MTDAEYIFKSTSAERKRIGRGDFNKKRKGGRFVRLPSDNLTKKEIEKMNGECLQYNMNAPVKWSGFLTWPQDLQREYIEKLTDFYNAKNEDIAKMFGVSVSQYRKLKNGLGIKGKPGHGNPLIQPDWDIFLGVDDPFEEVEFSPVNAEKVELPEQKEQKTYTIRDACVEHMKEEVKQIDIQNIAAMLRALVGTGAKLTIEVTL